MHVFDRATAVHADAAGHWSAELDERFWAPAGPNGGYLAAIVLRALTQAVDDPTRAPRTMTLHFLRPPAVGSAEVIATVERTGRSLTTLSVRLEQDGRLCVLGLAAFSAPVPSALDYARAAPVVPPPQELKQPRRPDGAPPIFGQLETRPCLGPRVFSGADEALTGGWLGFSEPRAIDALALAFLLDAWLPAPYTRLRGPVPAPTAEMTFHFRTTLPDDGEPGLVLGPLRLAPLRRGLRGGGRRAVEPGRRAARPEPSARAAAPRGMKGHLGLGGNLGDRRANLQAAVDQLAAAGVTTLASSSVYETDPFGPIQDQPAFFNACVRVETALDPPDLLAAAQAVERALGRPSEHVDQGPRTVDVDVLLLDDGPLDGPALTVPHPGILERRFVLIPLLELDLELALPDGRRLADALPLLPLTDDVRRAGPPLRLAAS